MNPKSAHGDVHQQALASFAERLLESEKFHMGTGKVQETLRRLAADLEAVRIDYAIVGGMALNAHGYQRETTDVDVRIRPQDLKRFRDQYAGRGYVERFAGARKSFRQIETSVSVEFLTTGEFPGDGKPKPVAFPDPKDAAMEISGLKVVTLPWLIELKLASGMTQPSRLRDLADVQDLIRILRLDSSFAEMLHTYVRGTYLMLLCQLEGDASRRD